MTNDYFGSLERLLKQVEKPASYIGEELNMVRKDPENVNVRFAFAFPDTYEIGMSYLGMQILYDCMNKMEDVYCERVFAPASDMEELMRSENVPLFTLESKTPLDEMDVVGFTLQYEMSFTNILNMLDLAGISVLKEERGEDAPLIIAGGPCAYEPEPLADFIDAFLIGDGEELICEFCSVLRDAKKTGKTRLETLQDLAGLQGVYVPQFYDVLYNADGTIKEFVKIDDHAPDKVTRALIKDIQDISFPTKSIVPYIRPVHDRSVVETFRGCTRGCRFCQAGMIYRPVRERSKDRVVELAREQLKNTGHEELSLLSLSTSDHSQFEDMTLELMAMCKADNVALSLPSLRLDSFSFKVLDEIQGYRKSGLTFAPEAGTQRLRDVINKGITEESIYSSITQAIGLGYNTIKLYFMAGLPTETYEDLDGIAEIARKIRELNFELRGRKGGRLRITVSVSNFVPKAHTPFQWEPQDTEESFRLKHDHLSKRLDIKGVTFNYHDSDTSFLEAVFARGDRRVGKVLYRAWQLGCRFDAWSEHFKGELWQKAFEETGVDPAFYANRRRSYDEVLPWDIIDSGISKEFLIRENEKAKNEQLTCDCREKCNACGMQRMTDCYKRARIKADDQIGETV